MVVVVGEGGDDGGAQLVRLGMGELERGDLLEVVVQSPWVVDQAQQDQRLAAGDRRALAAHDRAHGELRARRLVGTAGHRGACGRRPAAAAAPCG